MLISSAVILGCSAGLIQFQHSHISVEEFERRNASFQSKGMTVIWLFDFDNFKRDERIKEMDMRNLEYTNPNWAKVLRSKNQIPYTLMFYERKFGTFKPQLNSNVQLFFSYTEDGFTKYRKIVYVNDGYSIITTQVIEDSDEFLDICKQDVLFTPVEDITVAIRADEERIRKIIEAKEIERANNAL